MEGPHRTAGVERASCEGEKAMQDEGCFQVQAVLGEKEQGDEMGGGQVWRWVVCWDVSC